MFNSGNQVLVFLKYLTVKDNHSCFDFDHAIVFMFCENLNV